MVEDAEIARAVAAILGELNRLLALGLNENRVSKIRRETIFFLHEGGEQNKWAWERPHSSEARRRHAEYRAQGRAFNGKAGVVYDHAIPLAMIRDGLASAVDVSAFLKAHIAGVIILRTEDALLSRKRLRASMPSGARSDDPLARYRFAGISFDPEDEARLIANSR
jgi:hypothetical protein